MDRRNFMRTGAAAGAGLAVGSAVGCGKASVSFEISIVRGAIKDLELLLPARRDQLEKVYKVVADFGVAYDRGDFDSAAALFENVVGDVSQLIADIGIADPKVAVVLGILNIGLRAIAALLHIQAQQPAVRAALATRTNAADTKRIRLINRLASEFNKATKF